MEARFGAGRLLCLHERPTGVSRSLQVLIDTIHALKDVFGNTISSTLYRFVEAAGGDRPIVGMITGHPHVSRRSEDFNPSGPCRHFSRSPGCERCVGRESEAKQFAAVADYCGVQGGGPLEEDELFLSNDNGDRHQFQRETLFNRYGALTPGRYLHPVLRALAVSGYVEDFLGPWSQETERSGRESGPSFACKVPCGGGTVDVRSTG